MNYLQIKKLQKEYGYLNAQESINNGLCWKMEGSVGRNAMSQLESGVCMLPKKAHNDAYGNRVPSRDDLKKGTKGTFQNSVRFWTQVQNGEIDLFTDD